MREKTIIVIVLVAFIGGAAAWLHIRRKNKLRQIDVDWGGFR
ncbi:hypothetical protein C806_02127 [Lachnospiraceae bacterium 3-1]|nr:hypothetical protein C806_02127 [Lachnospiraceae bacterium 3-1]